MQPDKGFAADTARSLNLYISAVYKYTAAVYEFPSIVITLPSIRASPVLPSCLDARRPARRETAGFSLYAPQPRYPWGNNTQHEPRTARRKRPPTFNSDIIHTCLRGFRGTREKYISETTHTHPYFRGVDREGHNLKAKIGWLSLVSVRLVGSSHHTSVTLNPNTDLQHSLAPIAIHARDKVTPRNQHGNAYRCRVLQ